MKSLRDLKFSAFQGFYMGVGIGAAICLFAIDFLKQTGVVFPQEDLLKFVGYLGVVMGLFTLVEIFFADEEDDL